MAWYDLGGRLDWSFDRDNVERAKRNAGPVLDAVPTAGRTAAAAKGVARTGVLSSLLRRATTGGAKVAAKTGPGTTSRLAGKATIYGAGAGAALLAAPWAAKQLGESWEDLVDSAGDGVKEAADDVADATKTLLPWAAVVGGGIIAGIVLLRKVK